MLSVRTIGGIDLENIKTVGHPRLFQTSQRILNMCIEANLERISKSTGYKSKVGMGNISTEM